MFDINGSAKDEGMKYKLKEGLKKMVLIVVKSSDSDQL